MILLKDVPKCKIMTNTRPKTFKYAETVIAHVLVAHSAIKQIFCYRCIGNMLNYLTVERIGEKEYQVRM